MCAVYADEFFGTKNTLSSAVYDLSECHNIKDVLVLLTNEPMPNAFHEPILPVAPKGCNYEVDVVPGCHAETQQSYLFHETIGTSCIITFHRVVTFFEKHGVHFNLSEYKFDGELGCFKNANNPGGHSFDEKQVLAVYDEALIEAKLHAHTKGPLKREMHLGNEIITKYSTEVVYLNGYHQKLINENGGDVDGDTLFSVKTISPKKLSRFFHVASRIFQILVLIPTLLDILLDKCNNSSERSLEDYLLIPIYLCFLLRVIYKLGDDCYSHRFFKKEVPVESSKKDDALGSIKCIR